MEILQQCHGNSMEIPWRDHRNPIGIPWKYHGKNPYKSFCFLGFASNRNSTGTQWKYHEKLKKPMSIPIGALLKPDSHFKEISSELDRNIMEIPKDSWRNPIGIQWKSFETPLEFH